MAIVKILIFCHIFADKITHDFKPAYTKRVSPELVDQGWSWVKLGSWLDWKDVKYSNRGSFTRGTGLEVSTAHCVCNLLN